MTVLLCAAIPATLNLWWLAAIIRAFAASPSVLTNQAMSDPLGTVTLGISLVLVAMLIVISCVAAFSRSHSDRALKVLALWLRRDEIEPPDEGRGASPD
ncbi:hypothetical protein ACFQSB_01775 [Sphaerisporangium rhizosphaerae]|uniref:Uncharacterized protein n=1 Tax=Sphaerisporangium rhizosphaerae TaxID=2269375 RepID=A0ABW2NXI3_9ACTN